jgi:PAS domain S-box-containing protein
MTPPVQPAADANLRAALEAAEKALLESQRQYREIFELASIGIFRSTPDGQIVLANPALAEMLGYDSPEQLRALDLARDVYLHGDERRALVARYEHADRPWSVEVQWKKRDGTPLWVHISAHATPNEGGGARYFEAFVQDVTERRRAEEALRQSEARYRALASNLPDASVFLFDHDLRYLVADGTNFKASGLSKEALEGRTIWDVLPADLCERLAPRYRAVLAGEAVQFEETYNDRQYDVHLLPIRGAGGDVIYGMGVSVDITERHRAQARLAENEMRMRAIIDAEPECVKLLDAQGRLLTMNPAGLAMVEADALEQVVGESILAVVAPEFRDAFADLMRRVFQGESGTLEFEVVGLRGTRRLLDTHAVPLRDPAGRITALLGITRDITDRKRTERALRESEERLRLVTRATNDAVWDWDLATDTVWWGDGFHNLFGYAAHEIEPSFEAWHNRLHPEDRERVIERIRSTIDTGLTFWVDEYRFLRRDGTYADIYDRGYVIHADGRPVRMVGSMMDVTDRKRAEGQLRGLAARLEAIREEERTRIAREIHDQLGQALTALKMDLAWLAKKLPPRGTALRSKLEGMEGVIDGTMDAMHRIVAELRPGVLDDLGLPAAIRWLASEFQDRTHIRCTTSVTGEEPVVATGQATAVFRILQEALTNVARHARARHVDIRFHVLPTALELVVADDGRGITPDEAQNRRTLGILGIRERAATWHGQVTVLGEAGRGTTLRVFMPIAPPVPAPARVPAPLPAARTG